MMEERSRSNRDTGCDGGGAAASWIDYNYARPFAEGLACCASFNQCNRISGSFDRLSTSGEVR